MKKLQEEGLYMKNQVIVYSYYYYCNWYFIIIIIIIIIIITIIEKRVDGVNVGKEAQMTTSKSLMLLEANLNKLLQRKSEIIKQNKDKKAEINHFRILRLII
jgi:hypothetical protein